MAVCLIDSDPGGPVKSDERERLVVFSGEQAGNCGCSGMGRSDDR